MASLGRINLAPEVDFDVADEYRLNEARREQSKRAKLDLAIAKAAEGDAEIARKAAKKKAEQELGRQGVLKNYINDREQVGGINLGVVAPEYAPEQEFGPQVQKPDMRPNLAPIERRARLDLNAISPEYSEAFRTGMDAERETVAGRQRSAEDQQRENDTFKRAGEKETWEQGFKTRQQGETERHNNITETLTRMGILAKGSGKAKGKILPSNRVTELSDQASGIDLLGKLRQGTPKGMNPMFSWFRTRNPYDTDAQTFNQYQATTKQIIGKALEGGVLRLEDEKKYEKILPKASDTKSIRRRKEAQLAEMLVNRRNEQLRGLGNAGYDVENQGLSELNEDDAAILWAMRNPNDPRAQQLLRDLDKEE